MLLCRNFNRFTFVHLFQTKKDITAVDLEAFAQNVSDLATKFQTAAAKLSGDNQTKAYVSAMYTHVHLVCWRIFHATEKKYSSWSY